MGVKKLMEIENVILAIWKGITVALLAFSMLCCFYLLIGSTPKFLTKESSKESGVIAGADNSCALACRKTCDDLQP